MDKRYKHYFPPGYQMGTAEEIQLRHLIQSQAEEARSAKKPHNKNDNYGPNRERDKWLFKNRAKMTLRMLEDRLEKKAASQGWTAIGQPGIRKAIKRFAAYRNKAIPVGKSGRPKT